MKLILFLLNFITIIAISQEKVPKQTSKFFIEPTLSIESYGYSEYGYFGAKDPAKYCFHQTRANFALNMIYRNQYLSFGLGTSFLILGTYGGGIRDQIQFFREIYTKGSFNILSLFKNSYSDDHFGPYVALGLNTQETPYGTLIKNPSFGMEVYHSNFKFWAGYGVFINSEFKDFQGGSCNQIVGFGFGYSIPIPKRK